MSGGIHILGGGWGNAINIDNWPESENEKQVVKVHGFKNPKPLVGDLLRIPMKSGKVLINRFVSVKNCGDPADMFFAEVAAWHYEGEEPGPEPKDETERSPWWKFWG